MNQALVMNSMPPQSVGLEAQREQANRAELVERLARAVREDGRVEPLKGLRLNRASAPTELAHSVSDPAFCVIAQGSKEVFLGSDRYLYDPMHYLLATAELPVVSHVIEASPERPYLSLVLKLDPTLVSAVMVEAGHLAPRSYTNVRAIDVSPLNAGLLDAVVRLVRLLDTPAEASFLMPLITREIIFRLLKGEQGDRLCYIAVQGGHTHRIARAIQHLRQELDQPLRIDDLARELGMSVSSFHHHFKEVTAMSPLQYQKQIRLQEARRLMLTEDLDAASAGYRVGYKDAAHFNREYKKLFGLPPLRDVERLRESAMGSAA
ncbi:MAG TPA: AraC family transcriptional regulator [Anaerolineae bacterium]|nr:AraC family transcriptional regulator [Anaerolineae bacterium]HQK13499.1 AraC family transcriptional regulator [Anaerolineae bacterium]